jgi:hypothetical protein
MNESEQKWIDQLKHEHNLYKKHLKVYEDEILEYKEAARSEANIVDELQTENKKLRKALEIYVNAKGLVFTDKGLHLKDARNGSSFELQEPAREALKKEGKK